MSDVKLDVITAEPRSALPPTADLEGRLSQSPLLIALDIDGTVAPIAPTPEAAAVPEETHRVLERLPHLDQVYLAFVTGRAARIGRDLVNVARSWTIGNHGIEMIDPTGALRVNGAVEAFASTIAKAVDLIGQRIGRLQGVIVENKSWTLSVHVRLAARGDIPVVEATMKDVAQQLDLRLIYGKEIFELRPPVDINKGTALLELAMLLGISDDAGALGGSLLYAGDDRTDEDAFRALRSRQWNAVTVHVGEGESPSVVRTEAEFVLPDPPALRELLVWLGSLREHLPHETA